MIEEQATVLSVGDGFAEVATLRRNACNSCDVKAGCGTSLIAAWFPQRRMTFQLRNEIGARPGDTVVVGLDEARLQRASMLLYGLPLAGLLLGAILGERIGTSLFGSAELGGVAGGLFGLTAALVSVRRLSGRRTRRSERDVRLLRVVGQPVTFPSGLAPAVQPEGIRKGE